MFDRSACDPTSPGESGNGITWVHIVLMLYIIICAALLALWQTVHSRPSPSGRAQPIGARARCDEVHPARAAAAGPGVAAFDAAGSPADAGLTRPELTERGPWID